MGKLSLERIVCIASIVFAVTSVVSRAQTFDTLVSFNAQDGGNAFYYGSASLVQGTDGNFYGVASTGGAHGLGTVFQVTPTGTLTALHSFSGTDGSYPYSGLIQAADGNFYGTTTAGGSHGFGTAFRITPSGRLVTIHNFDGTDGGNIDTELLQAPSGNFFGTSTSGGAHGSGTVFKMTPAGNVTTLYSFCSQANCTDGSYPHAGLVRASNGIFYGTTAGGGAHGYGTVFRISAKGTFTMLYNFCAKSNCSDGATPYGTLVQAPNGNFYGTTNNGGIGGPVHGGTVFEITPGGRLSVLYAFCAQTACADGQNPYAGLRLATDGNFYGTTGAGGAYSSGAIFRITASGAFTALYSFCSTTGCPDGQLPFAGLVQGSDGRFYGTAYLGGANNQGTVYSLLAP